MATAALLARPGDAQQPGQSSNARAVERRPLVLANVLHGRWHQQQRAPSTAAGTPAFSRRPRVRTGSTSYDAWFALRYSGGVWDQRRSPPCWTARPNWSPRHARLSPRRTRSGLLPAPGERYCVEALAPSARRSRPVSACGHDIFTMHGDAYISPFPYTRVCRWSGRPAASLTRMPWRHRQLLRIRSVIGRRSHDTSWVLKSMHAYCLCATDGASNSSIHIERSDRSPGGSIHGGDLWWSGAHRDLRHPCSLSSYRPRGTLRILPRQAGQPRRDMTLWIVSTALVACCPQRRIDRRSAPATGCLLSAPPLFSCFASAATFAKRAAADRHATHRAGLAVRH